MFCEPDNVLKGRLKMAGLTYRHLSQSLKIPYNTLCHWINGYTAMPIDARRRIEQMITEAMDGRIE